jgi:hypothetical protein
MNKFFQQSGVSVGRQVCFMCGCSYISFDTCNGVFEITLRFAVQALVGVLAGFIDRFDNLLHDTRDTGSAEGALVFRCPQF